MYPLWHQLVFVRLLFPFVLGILCHSFFSISKGWWWCLGIFLAVVFIYFLPIKVKSLFRFRFVSGYLIVIGLFTMGFLLAHFHTLKKPTAQLENMQGFIATVIEEPVQRLKSSKLFLEISTVFYTTDTLQVNEKIVAYFAQQNDVSSIHYGDVLYVHADLQRIAAPLNPSQFDYQKYMDGKGIFYQTFVPENAFVKLTSGTRKDVMYYVIQVRTMALKTLENLQLKEREFAIAAALIFGYQEDLNQETKNSFIKTGSMHILAVSGMHVGIIFIMITRILFFMDKKKWMRTLRFFIILFLLWFYTLLCGFSPAILRAAVMFTFILPATTWKLSSNTYNSIAASAFFLLLFDTQMLYDVGLQLSYFAVLGIVMVYPMIEKIWQPKIYILKECWTIVAVSIAATLATLPISLYYFGQFANSFLLANLVLVPVSAIVLYVGIAAILLAWIPYLSVVLGFVLHWSIKIMYACIYFIEHLPFSYYDKLYTTGWQALLIFALLLMLLLFFQFRKAYFLKTTLAIFILFQFSLLWRQIHLFRHEEIIVYSVNKETYVEWIRNHKAYLLVGNFPKDETYLYTSKAYHQKMGVRDTLNVNDSSLFYKYDNFVNVRGCSLFLYDEKWAHKKLSTPFNVDFLILSNVKWFDIKHLQENFTFRKVIIDSSVPLYKSEKWETLLHEAQIEVHNVQKDGAFRFILTN